jgi:hypothetical protein
MVTVVLLSLAVVSRAGADMPAQPGRVLEFQVVSRETKEPLAGVNLEIRLGRDSRKEVTDEQGRCKIEYGLQQTEYVSVTARQSGLVPMQVAWRATEPGVQIPERYTLALEPGTTIGGFIRDEEGKPVAGAVVHLLVPSRGGIERVALYDHRVKTGPKGDWQCNIVPAKLDEVWIRLEHSDYVSDEMYGKTPKPPIEKLRDMTGVMVMRRGITVAGRVLDIEGRPIEGVAVAQGSDRFGSSYPSVRTDQEGRFQFGNARPGEMVLTVQARGYAPDLKQISVARESGPVDFRLEPGRTLRGRLVDKAGQPVAGAFVAADTWRGHRSLQWRVDTDAEGRFEWKEAPADEVLVDIGKQNYMSVRRNPMTASDQEYVVTMHPVLHIRGRVTDKETGQSIPRLTITPGIAWSSGQPVLWERDVTKAFTDGRYEITFGEPRYGHLIRVEAEGYLPEVSRAFEDGEGEVAFDIALKKGAGLSGIVCLPEGTPVAGAEVILCTGVRSLFIQNGRNAMKRESVFVETGPDGRFALPPQTEPFTLLVLHEQGCTHVMADEWGSSAKVTLQPWGRVAGQVLIGSQPGAGQEVRVLFYNPSATGMPRVNWQYGTVADKEGRFVLERVPPGQGKVCREIRISDRSGRFTDYVPIEIKAGQTTNVIVGGTGRPVVGKVVFPDEVKARLDWQSLDYYLRSSSAEGATQYWAFKIESDGTFRADNIPAGEHCFYLTAYAVAVYARMFRGERLGVLTHPFTIPEIPGGRSDEPLDLGVLELLAVGGSAPASALIGQPAPDLKGLKLDLSPEAVAGKSLLVCFFDLDQRPSRNIVLQLAQRVEELKNKGVVVVAVQGSPADEAKLKDWARQNVVTVPVGMIPGNESKARFAWGVRSLPWLVLTDKGHIVRAEGFGLSELDSKVDALAKP